MITTTFTFSSILIDKEQLICPRYLIIYSIAYVYSISYINPIAEIPISNITFKLDMVRIYMWSNKQT